MGEDGEERTRRRTRGNRKLGGSARDAHPLLISLTFLSLAVKKANYSTLIWAYVSAQTTLMLGMITMTITTMVTV